MRLTRFYCLGRIHWGEALEEGVRSLEGTPFEGNMQPTDHILDWDAVHPLPASNPTKIVCAGSNYREHCREMGRPVPEYPKIFLKPPSTLIADGDSIQLPPNVGQVDYEGELAVIIGRKTRNVSSPDVGKHILGYSILNDVTARDIQKKDALYTRAKGFDTFCPLGPVIVSDLNPAELSITTTVNGEVRQNSHTSEMIFNVNTLVSYISSIMTLEPGDVISTGTPSGVGALNSGDTVSITIEGIGTLNNPVRDA